MFEEEEYTSDNCDLSVLDIARIEDLEVGEKMEGESSNFTVFRQNPKQYHVHLNRGKNQGGHGFVSLEKVVEYLEQN